MGNRNQIKEESENKWGKQMQHGEDKTNKRKHKTKISQRTTTKSALGNSTNNIAHDKVTKTSGSGKEGNAESKAKRALNRTQTKPENGEHSSNWGDICAKPRIAKGQSKERKRKKNKRKSKQTQTKR